MAIAGLRGTGDWGTDERPKNFREMILWLNANGDAPITALMSKMPKATTDDPEFAWWEETLDIVRLQLNDATNLTTAETTVTVDNGNGATAEDLKPGDLLLFEEGAETDTYDYEIVRVASITSATVFEVIRAQAGTTAGTLTDDAFMTLIGSSYEEGTVAADATTRNPTKHLNYTQIFKDTYEITGTADATHTRTGDTLKNDKKRKAFDHARGMEEAWLFGSAAEITGANGKPQRFCGGIMHRLANMTPSRVVVRGAAYTSLTGLLDDIYDVFDYTGDGSTGGDQRIGFLGNGAMNILNKLSLTDGTVNFGEIVKVFGMNFTRFVMPQGELFVKTHPLLNRHPRYQNTMFVIDPPGIRYRPLRGRDTKTENNIQTPGQDSKKGQWVTEAGIEVNHGETMKVVTNITI